METCHGLLVHYGLTLLSERTFPLERNGNTDDDCDNNAAVDVWVRKDFPVGTEWKQIPVLLIPLPFTSERTFPLERNGNCLLCRIGFSHR